MAQVAKSLPADLSAALDLFFSNRKTTGAFKSPGKVARVQSKRKAPPKYACLKSGAHVKLRPRIVKTYTSMTPEV